MRNMLRAVLLAGLPVSALLMLAAAVLDSAAELPAAVLPVLAACPPVTGCFCAGCSAGRHSRRAGLRCGAAAALLLSLIWLAAAYTAADAVSVPAVLPVLLAAGACGGVLGVNARPPRIRRRSKTLRYLRERLHLLPAEAAAVRIKRRQRT